MIDTKMRWQREEKINNGTGRVMMARHNGGGRLIVIFLQSKRRLFSTVSIQAHT